jgi:hypothetical protein
MHCSALACPRPTMTDFPVVLGLAPVVLGLALVVLGLAPVVLGLAPVVLGLAPCSGQGLVSKVQMW